ncbi:preprotein translocase subunit SecB [Cytophagaceae bacterium ABcell3]|nr:preprotein translocase subunit SecB [Cytophagaceae bacterium ABcell3]
MFNNYNIDIDFALKSIDENLFQLFTKININDLEKPLPGYVLFIEGVCIFAFDKPEELSNKEKSNLLHISGLNICINSLRNNLTIATANGPLGKYTLPSIDVNKLLIDKQAEQNTKKANKENT